MKMNLNHEIRTIYKKWEQNHIGKNFKWEYKLKQLNEGDFKGKSEELSRKKKINKRKNRCPSIRYNIWKQETQKKQDIK